MDNLDLDSIKTIYFIGIGGISMRALAKISLSIGKKVLGSNMENNE